MMRATGPIYGVRSESDALVFEKSLHSLPIIVLSPNPLWGQLIGPSSLYFFGEWRMSFDNVGGATAVLDIPILPYVGESLPEAEAHNLADALAQLKAASNEGS